MLGYESERRLKNFLVAVGDGERDLELARQRLCNIPDFAPHAAFQRIDRDYSLQITSREFASFLRDNGIYHVLESELHNLIVFFDSNGNQRISFQEFLQIVLPCEDNFLRNRTLDRPSRHVSRYDYLPRDIELALASVIEKEIDLQRRLETLKRELEVQYDYSPYAAFRSIDRYNSGRIDQVNVGSFLRQNGHYASELELLAIVRRVDTDGDAVILYSEWAEFVRAAYPAPRPLASTPPRPASAARYGASSPLKSSSPVRPSSAGRSGARYSSPVRPAASISPSRLSPSRKPILRIYDEDELVHGLKDLCNQEQELETAKIALAQKHDFNLRDAFDIFDVPRYGQIDSYQLRSGLNAINVFPTSEEIDLFIQRYDKNGDRRLTFHEFQNAFLARDRYYSDMVTRRPSNYTPRPIRRDDCFLPNTAFEFQNMWRTHFRVESSGESLRQRLNSRPGFNCYEAFNSLDLNDNGSLDATELKRMIESRGYFVSYQEVDNLVDKMDKNKDGRVTFAEFRDETLPKSPARR
jgi:Ca2+-binding EF-hand superfamily protein